uniref:Uncharacterized protein n=1 Tax=uncultured marine virus TaxID=186617 RepID=A0A0F7L365_9VIRU|nr:hypothetical protein [uncultured marine virus]
MRINLTDTDNIEDLRSVPAGEYHCKAVEVCESESPAGHTRWGIRWEIVAGDFKGRTACWDSLHWSERGKPRVAFILQMLGFPRDGQELSLKTSDLVGRSAMVEITPEEREDPVSGIRRLMNRVPFAGYAPAPEPTEAERSSNLSLLQEERDYQRASSHFLSRNLPDGFADMLEDDLLEFVDSHTWEPLQSSTLSPTELMALISEVAADFASIREEMTI